MRILVANWVYGSGSTGFIVRDLKKGLEEKGHTVLSLAGVVDKQSQSEAIAVTHNKEFTFFRRLTRIGWPYFQGSPHATKRFIKEIKDFNPDVVHLHLLGAHCLNFFTLLEYLANNNIPTVITNHAEVYYTGCCEHAFDCNEWIENRCRHCKRRRLSTGAIIFGNPHLNWVLMKKALSSFQDNLIVTAVSPWLQSRVLQSEMMKRFQCYVVGNGVDTKTFYRRGKTSFDNHFLNNSYIIHVTALFDPLSKQQVKGGKNLILLAKLMPDMTFVVVASSSCNTSELPGNVFLYGRTKDQNELATLYSNASLTLITSRRETFSMVTAESLCCGTPVVGFKAGGPESIAIKEASRFVEYGDIEALKICIEDMLKYDVNRDELSRDAANRYSLEVMTEKYIEVYNQLLSDNSRI